MGLFMDIPAACLCGMQAGDASETSFTRHTTALQDTQRPFIVSAEAAPKRQQQSLLPALTLFGSRTN